MLRTGLMALAGAAILTTTPSLAIAQTPSPSPVYGPRTLTLAPADQLAIHDIIARMNQAIDANDYKTYADFYTEDGVIDSGFGPPNVGRPAIVASLEQSAPFITNKRHVAGNIVLNDDAGTVTAVYYLTVFERQTGLTLAGTAVITDQFRRGPQGWQVIRHTTRMDPATLGAMAAAMSAPSR